MEEREEEREGNQSNNKTVYDIYPFKPRGFLNCLSSRDFALQKIFSNIGDFFVATTRGEVVASSGYRPKLLLNILQCTE